MGASVFIMAQLISVPYLKIATSSIGVALLYYLSVFVAVHYFSKKMGIRGTGIRPKISITELAIILVPISVFIVYLVFGYSVQSAAFYSTVISVATCVICYFIDKKNVRAVVKETGSLCYKIALDGAEGILSIAGLLAGSQISITLISMTGFGIKMSQLIIDIGRNNLFFCLLLAMIVCTILGMAFPRRRPTCWRRRYWRPRLPP
jgi:TRAP-type uncharacterized transport system fused permease subunit